ncbi:ankyrin repeat-containing domain protein [Xylaria palmicola]|nr:ankyrin repeat-containing domain protein [Xylaria palmicola]
MQAAFWHRVDVVIVLLLLGADARATAEPGFFGEGALEKAMSLHSKDSQRTPRGAMLKTVQALLESMANTSDSRLLDIDIEPGAPESWKDDDAHILDALRRICKVSRKHEDKLEVVALLLRYKGAVETAKEAPNLVYKSLSGTNFDVSDLLLENGFHRPCERQFAKLIQKYLKKDVAEGLRHILNRFPDIFPQTRTNRLLRDAVRAGQTNCVELLINEGASIHYPNGDGSSLLFIACVMGHYTTAEVLLKNGANPDEYVPTGDSLITLAASEEEFEIESDGIPGNGVLDVAISRGLVDAIDAVVDHENFGSPTDDEISTHWQTLIHAPWSDTLIFTFVLLLEHEHLEKNRVFEIIDHTGDEPKSVVTTPLHLCAAVSLLVPEKPDSQVHSIKLESRFESIANYEFEGTTPLEWAIKHSSVLAVYYMLPDPCYLPSTSETVRATRTDLILYTKAACRRQEPRILYHLLTRAGGLDPTVCDEDGNTMVHMICDYVGSLRPGNGSRHTMERIAIRSILSLLVCLEQGVAYQARNSKGVSGTDRVLEIMQYSGTCAFRRILFEHYRAGISYDEGEPPVLTPQYEAADDPDYKDEQEQEQYHRVLDYSSAWI